MIARRTAAGLLGVVLSGAVALLGIAGCGDDESTVPTVPAAVTTTTPPAASPTVPSVPAVGSPIVPTEVSTSPSRTTSRTSRRPRTTTPTRRTVTVPDNASGRALFRCLASGGTYDECVD